VQEERFLVSARVAASLPSDVVEELRGLAGEAALKVPGLLDGSRTAAQVAAETALPEAQVAAVIRVLAARKLAMRYVSRSRRPAGV
jgi:hypothetical protein